MAKIKDNILLTGTSGSIGKEIVLRKFKQGTFSGKHPDMSHVIPSKNQTKGRQRFAEAVKYARSVMKNAEKKAADKSPEGYSLYHASIKEYLARYRPDKNLLLGQPEAVRTSLEALTLREAQQLAVAYILAHHKITNSSYQKINEVSKATASRHLQELVNLNILEFNGGKGAGAYYILGSLFDKKGA